MGIKIAMTGFLNNLNFLSRKVQIAENADFSWIMAAPMPIAILDRDGMIKTANPAWRANTRFGSIALITGEDLLLSGGAWMRPTLTPLSSHSDLQVCTLMEINDLKMINERSHPDYYRRILDVFEDCVKVIDPAGRLLFLNRSGRRVLNVGEHQTLGMKWVDLVPPGAASKVEQILEQVLAGETVHFSNHSQFPGEEAQTWHHILTPYRDPNGLVIAALCVSRNVTTDYDLQEATRINEERLTKAAKAAGLGIWDIDLRTQRVHCNDLWYDVVGIPRSTAITSMAQFLPYIHHEDAERMRTHWQARGSVNDSHGEYRARFKVVDVYGNTRHIHATAAIIRDIAGLPVRAIGFVTTAKP